MLPVAWLIVAVVVAVLLTMWVTFTLTRLDRLHARVDAAQAALDAQLVRRAAALLHVAESADSGVPDERRRGWDITAQRALNTREDEIGRQTVENAVGRAVAELAELPRPLSPDVAAELREASTRVLIARRFYNDAVRDTRSLRARRLPRLLHMAGHRAMPDFFDIDDTVPPALGADTLMTSTSPATAASSPTVDTSVPGQAPVAAAPSVTQAPRTTEAPRATEAPSATAVTPVATAAPGPLIDSEEDRA